MQRQFENLTATELFCPRCRIAQPVRERLLLVLPRSELHDYRCRVCGESCGTREVKAPPVAVLRQQSATPPIRRRTSPGGGHRDLRKGG